MGNRVELVGALTLVTGAGSGIGRATALALASRRARVLVVGRRLGPLEETVEACLAAGAPESVAFSCDVADATAVGKLAGEVHERWHPLDVLVNNAGVGITGPFADMTLDDWRWIRGVNIDGVVHVCHAFGPAMVERGRGHVVNMSSGLGYAVTATESAYVASRAAVLMLSQCLRADWGPKGVGVTVACPGLVDTPFVDATRFVGAADNEANRTNLTRAFRRFGHKPEAVAKAVVHAIEHDRAMVAPGWESKLVWALHRVLPLAVHQRYAQWSAR